MGQLFDDNETLPLGLQEDKYTLMRKLVDEIKKYSRSYYIDNVSLISDYEFDMKFKELQQMEEDLNFVFDDSPTKKVGSDLQEGFKEVKHEIQMGSVENCYDYPSIVKYFTNIWNDYKKNPSNSVNVDFYKNHSSFLIVEPKFDGLSCSLIYQYGHLVQASTRGNGFIGSDITENIKCVSGVPQHIPMMSGSKRFEVRGEVLMPKSTFNRLNEERAKNGDKLFANARNAASGSLKQLDPLVTKERDLIFMPYNAFCKDDLHFSPFGSYNRYNENEIVCYLLPSMGFNTFPYILCNVEQLEAALESFKEKIFTNQDYCMDGAVVKLNDLMLQDEMGYDKKCPDWCRAMKWKQESTCVTTILRDVEL